MKYGIYFAYWEKEWNVDQKKYISKVKDLGFDILEISCAMLKNISKDELLEMKKMAEDAGVMLTAGYSQLRYFRLIPSYKSCNLP